MLPSVLVIGRVNADANDPNTRLTTCIHSFTLSCTNRGTCAKGFIVDLCKQARKSSEDTQVAGYARFEKHWAG